MHTQSRRMPGVEIADVLLGCNNIVCNLHILSLLTDPSDLVRAAAVSPHWRRFVIEHGLCKRLFFIRFSRVTHVAYEVEDRYHIIRLSDVISGDAADWSALERNHIIYSYLLQPRSKRMDCPRDCLLFPVGDCSTSGVVENILTSMTPICTYPVGYSFLSSEGQSEITETCNDFIKCLEPDTCISIMNFLDDPADIVRVSAVSRFWRQFVIANGRAKLLCLKILPQIATIAGVVIGGNRTTTSVEAGTRTAMETEFSESNHTVYSSLLHAIKNSTASRSDCIQYAICASSTDNFRSKSVRNTLRRRDRMYARPSYWLSKGQSNPEVPETLIYKLRPGPWLITAIDLQPFQSPYRRNVPLFVAKSVRFRLGHPKSANEISSNPYSFPLVKPIDDKFEWTYTSPEFPVIEENALLLFVLPEPTLCFDGYFQVELLGRVHKKFSDELFYMCLRKVWVTGRLLFPAFRTEMHLPSEGIWLRYFPEHLSSIMQNSGTDDNGLGEESMEDEMDELHHMLDEDDHVLTL